jgi:hypothetical protein
MHATLTPDPTHKRVSASHGKRWAIGIAIVLIVIIAAVAILTPTLTGKARDGVKSALEEYFASRLEMKSLDVSLIPSVHVVGRGIVLRHEDGDAPPLIVIDQFTADTNLLSLLFDRIHTVRLDGLQVRVLTGGVKKPSETAKQHHKKPPHFVLDEVIADGARVETIPAKSGKVPLVWNIRKLTLQHVTPDSPMSFQAELVNAKPPGEIQSQGSFGPWQRDDPAETPVSGSYKFRDADLSVFHGISGKLSSDGKYSGVLERLEVSGHTDIPDFALKLAGNKLDLATDFHALVDGTNGTTHLQPVVARFGKTTLTASGVVDTTPGQPGQIISLDARVTNGRLQDVLLLAVKGQPPMTGAVSFHSKILLPLGNQDVIHVLALDGTFDADAARFSKPDAQQKVDKLSNRGRGQTNDAADDTVASNFSGSFRLRNGVMHFTNLAFVVPGVAVALDGDYGMQDGNLDLRGTARLQAKLSETTTGVKSFLLKAVNPFFEKKGAGTVLPIKITGNQDSPSFGLNLGGKAKSAH